MLTYGTLRSPDGSFGQLLNDQNRDRFGPVVAYPDHAERSAAQRDRVTGTPVRDGATERRRLRGGALRRFELEQEPCHSVLLLPGAERLGEDIAHCRGMP